MNFEVFIDKANKVMESLGGTPDFFEYNDFIGLPVKESVSTVMNIFVQISEEHPTIMLKALLDNDMELWHNMRSQMTKYSSTLNLIQERINSLDSILKSNSKDIIITRNGFTIGTKDEKIVKEINEAIDLSIASKIPLLVVSGLFNTYMKMDETSSTGL